MLIGNVDLYNDGLPYVWSIDRCDAVVKHMQAHVASLGLKTLAFKTMDANHTTYKDNAFHVVVEKATIDAQMTCDNALMAVHALLAEVRRVLKVTQQSCCESIH